MIIRRYIKDKYEGISVGLDCSYRAMKLGKQFVIYRMSDGKIVEKILYEKIDIINEDNAMKRLYEINNLEREVNREIIQEIDKEN